jgi:hypothetical protein
VAGACAGICSTSNTSVVLFMSPCNDIVTMWFMSCIGPSIHPFPTIAEAGACAVFGIGGMVHLLLHGVPVDFVRI